MKKIVIKGCIGNRNFGDDLLIYAISLALNQMEDTCDYYFLTEKKNYLDKIIKNIKIVRSNGLGCRFDTVLYAGGTQFASFKNTVSKSIPSFRRIIYLILHLNILWTRILAKIEPNAFSRRKILFIGIGIGPFYKKDKYYDSVIRLLKSADLMIVRDVLSQEICEKNQIKSILGSDLVYSLPLSFWYKYSGNRGKDPGVSSIAFIIRDWKFTDEGGTFLYRVKELTAYYNITFFSFADYADIESCKYLKENNIDVIQWNPDIMTIGNYLNELQKHDLFITARYHGAVIASLMKKPFITIGIEPKLEMIAELFDMPCWRFPYDISECIDYIKVIEGQYLRIQEKLVLAITREHFNAVKMLERLNANIRDKGNVELCQL